MRRIQYLALLVVIAGCGGNNSNGTGTPGFDANSRLNAGRDARVQEATKKLIAGPGAKVADASNDFGFKLLNGLLKDSPQKNVFISPISIEIALSMTMNGAVGDTKTGMATASGLSKLKADEVNQGARSLLTLLEGVDPQVLTTLANSLWIDKSWTLRPEFVKQSTDFYKSTVRSESLQGKEGADLINLWVRDNTKGKIEKLFEEMPPNTVAAIVNTIYFAGEWAKPFKPEQTLPTPFESLDGKDVPVPLMQQGGYAAYGKFDGFAGLSLPYGKGRVVMDIWLPDKGANFGKFASSFTAKNYGEWTAKMNLEEFSRIAIPRFETETDESLNERLKAMGMNLAFDPVKADFTGMHAGGGLFLSLVQHHAKITVNEKGTEAAAATGAVAATKGAPSPSMDFVCNRPFLYAIRDTQAKTILFLGAYLKP